MGDDELDLSCKMGKQFGEHLKNEGNEMGCKTGNCEHCPIKINIGPEVSEPAPGLEVNEPTPLVMLVLSLPMINPKRRVGVTKTIMSLTLVLCSRSKVSCRMNLHLVLRRVCCAEWRLPNTQML